ncbi:Polyadenylate-binding protein 8 [Raphanus sativus]|uniref:Maternally expressed PAB C-terminal protein-like n=1 Tax=Raphanus sativus TaxID=3726 RepID=A0A9W3BRR4_RAPSA|nr:maternally expressed PAB C-terminal protein-like [Raphanus sativus]KAJ4897814.1 Polyadenylate-binding protein 8 [Raphanus sativus]
MSPPVSVYSINDTLARAAALHKRFLSAALAEALEKKTPSEQRIMIGESLYPLVELLVPLFAPKITGMLLELPQAEIFRCLESPEALKEKINEAIVVLMDCYPKEMNLDEQETKKFRAAMLSSKL